MGYCYTLDHKLCCDSCGNSGGVRKRTCPYKIHYPEGGSLPYCPAPALCAECYKKYKPNLHKACKEPASRRQMEIDEKEKKIQAGESFLCAAFGEWHEAVPKGYTGCCFRGKDGETWVLVPKQEERDSDKPLSEYQNTIPWENHPGSKLTSIA